MRTGKVGSSRRRRFVPRDSPWESRRLLATDFQVSWLGQTSSMDLTGPDAGVGPDGYLDDGIANVITTKDPGLVVQSVQISLIGSPNPRWESAPNLDGSSNAELIDVSSASPAGRTTSSLQPLRPISGQNALKSGQGQQLEVNVSYTDKGNGASIDSLIVSVGSSDPAAVTPPVRARPGLLEWLHGELGRSGRGSRRRESSRRHRGADPPVLGAVLSDQVANGKYPSLFVLRRAGSVEPIERGPGSRQSGSTADLAFAPIASEACATLTLRLDFGAPFGQQAAQFLGGACDPG